MIAAAPGAGFIGAWLVVRDQGAGSGSAASPRLSAARPRTLVFPSPVRSGPAPAAGRPGRRGSAARPVRRWGPEAADRAAAV